MHLGLRYALKHIIIKITPAMITCNKCGQQVSENNRFCPNCGNDMQNTTNQQVPQHNYQGGWSNPPERKNNNAILYAIIGILVVLIIGGGGYFVISSNNKENEAKLEKLREKQEALEEKNEELQEKNEKLQEEKSKPVENTKIIVQKSAEHSAAHRAASAGGTTPKVVINGTGVRLRFSPSLSSGYLTWANGATRAPRKGARLTYTGETSDWYQVSYLGQLFYVSKEYSYLEY